MDSWMFILYVIIQYYNYFVAQIVQLWLLKARLGQLLYDFDMPSTSFGQFIFWPHKMFQAYLGWTTSPKSPRSWALGFCERSGWFQGVLASRSSQPIEPEIPVWILTHTHTHSSIILCFFCLYLYVENHEFILIALTPFQLCKFHSCFPFSFFVTAFSNSEKPGSH